MDLNHCVKTYLRNKLPAKTSIRNKKGKHSTVFPFSFIMKLFLFDKQQLSVFWKWPFLIINKHF